MYGILKDGIYREAPRYLKVDGKKIFNPTEEQLKAAGYKKVTREERPQTDEKHYLVEKITESEEKITISYEIRKVESSEEEKRLITLEKSQEEQSQAIDLLLEEQM